MHKNLLVSICLVLSALVVRAADGKLLDVASHNLNTDLKLELAQKFSSGDKLIVKGTATSENDSKIEVYGLKADGGQGSFVGQQDKPQGSNEFTIQSSNLEEVNNGFMLRGKNFVVTEIWYSGVNDLTPGRPGEGGGDNPDQPVVKDPVVIVPDINFYIAGWDGPDYKVRLQQQFKVGDKLIITVTGNKVKAKFCDNTGFDPETGSYKQNVFCEGYEIGGGKKDVEVVANDANLDWLNTGGIIVQGENITVNSISYQGQGEAVPGTTIFDGQEPPRELETWNLLPRIGDVSLIKPAWKGKATVSLSDDGGSVTITTTEEGAGAGVYARGIKADASDSSKLDVNSYLNPDESTAENPAPLNMFNKWGKLNISLAEACDNAEVIVWYRDIDIEEFQKDEPDLTNVGPNARPVSYTFAGGQKSMTIDFDAYRYIRAISIKLPYAGSVTVTELSLVERENYNGNDVSLWTCPRHLGTYLGRKSFYGGGDLDWNRGEDDSVTPAWVGVQTADCSQIDALYPHIIIVYKNAEVVHAQNGMNRDAAPQIQAYLNLPCYDIESYDKDVEYWKNRTWSYTDADGVSHENEKVVQKPNNDARTENLIVPVVAGIHTLRADKQSHGSYYAEIPEANYGKYSYAEIFVNGKQEVTYPVKEETPAAGVVSRIAGETPGIATGRKIDLLQKYGIALRGQNVTLMKVAYLGDIRDNYTDLDVPDDILKDTSTAIETVVETQAQPDKVDVYNLQGMMVRRGVAPENATSGLRQGIYIVNGKKVWVK